jgi:uncharacterized membrane protein (DUF485 family)
LMTNLTFIKELPSVLAKMTELHKARSQQPLFFLNIFFGLSLLFFVLSAFWMYMPKTSVFKKGLYFTFGGIVLTLILLFIWQRRVNIKPSFYYWFFSCKWHIEQKRIYLST